MALLDRHPFVLDAEINVLPDIVAGQLLQRLEAEIFLGPADMALIPQIHVLEPERDPAEPRLGKEDLQFRKALEDARQDQLRDAGRRRQAEIAQPSYKGSPDRLNPPLLPFGTSDAR